MSEFHVVWVLFVSLRNDDNDDDDEDDDGDENVS